ncbi:MAG: PEGA domain-containing protein [Chitinivibrionia bacterium]|nr:PEGA domain-containing protein [Chitinivibrionia bacterium]
MFNLKKIISVMLAALAVAWADEMIEITTNPAGARIYMNDSFLGVSPVTIPNAHLGNVIIRAELQGFFGHEVHFINHTGSSRNISLTLRNRSQQQGQVATAQRPQQQGQVVRPEDGQQRAAANIDEMPATRSTPTLASINCAVVKEAVEGLDEMTKGRDFQRTQGRIARFTRNAQRVETVMRVSGMSSSAPSATAMAGLSIEMLRTINDVNRQIMEFNGAQVNPCTESGFSELQKLNESLNPGTFLPLIVRASFATLPPPVVEPFRLNPVAALVMFAWIMEDYNLTRDQALAIITAALASTQGSVYHIAGEIRNASGPQKVQITMLLSFSSGVLAATVPQLREMTRQIQRIRTAKEGAI